MGRPGVVVDGKKYDEGHAAWECRRRHPPTDAAADGIARSWEWNDGISDTLLSPHWIPARGWWQRGKSTPFLIFLLSPRVPRVLILMIPPQQFTCHRFALNGKTVEPRCSTLFFTIGGGFRSCWWKILLEFLGREKFTVWRQCRVDVCSADAHYIVRPTIIDRSRETCQAMIRARQPHVRTGQKKKWN